MTSGAVVGESGKTVDGCDPVVPVVSRNGLVTVVDTFYPV